MGVLLHDVAVGSVLRVQLGANPQLAANNVPDRLFALLDHAQIAYQAKETIHSIATSPQPLSVRLSHLQALGIDRALETAVGEILLAFDNGAVV